MKRIAFFLFLVSTLGYGQSVDQDERKLALDILSQSYQVLEKSVNDLTPVELNYNPEKGGWTVLNCLEHLAFVEKTLGAKIRKMISENKQDKRKDLSENDWLIIARVTDRTNKVTTPEPFRPQPEMKDKSKDFFLANIKKHRGELINLIKETKVDLRHVFGPYLYGEADVTQQALVVGAHTYRHTMQIQEVLKELRENKQ